MSFMIALLVAPTLVAARASITYSCRVKSAEVVIADLAAATGEKLRIANGLAAEPLIVDVKDVEAQEVLDRVAEVLHGSWQRDELGLRLVRTPAMEHSIAKGEHKELVARVQQALDVLGKGSRWGAPFTSQEADALAAETDRLLQPGQGSEMRTAAVIDAALAKTPANRAIGNLLTKFPVESLAKCIERGYGAFAIQPNAMQRPLPSNCAPVFEKLLSEQADYIASMERFDAAHPRSSQDEIQVGYLKRPRWEGGDPKSGVGKILVTYMTLLNAIAANRSYDPHHWLAYRIYGSLNDAQKKLVFAGGNLKLTSLPATMQRDLTLLIFRDQVSAFLELPDRTELAAWENPISVHPTEALPNGLRDIEIWGEAKSEAAVFAMNSESGASGFETVQTLASFDYVRETPGMANFLPNLPSYDKFSPATVTEILLNFRTSSGFRFSQDLHDGKSDRTAMSSQYPGDIRSKVDAELAELRTVFGPNRNQQPPP